MLDGNEANGVWVDENIYNSCQITPTGWLLGHTFLLILHPETGAIYSSVIFKGAFPKCSGL